MIDDSIEILQDTLSNKIALIVSAGPSAVKWREIYSSIQDKDPTVVCVKQTVEMDGLGEICDIHFINSYNIKKYKYKKRPLIIFTDAVDAPRVFNIYDFKMIVIKDKKDSLEDTLAYKNNFHDFHIEVSGIKRPWGPGIMYEAVFHTLVYMGVKKIITVGWDVADSDGNNKHYYDKKYFNRTVSALFRKVFFLLKVGVLYDFINYVVGRKYNHAGMLKGEAEIVSNSIPHLKKWLNSRGVELEIISDSKWVS